MDLEPISYAKTVYGREEIDAVIKCLGESTQMGNYSRLFESKIAKLFDKKYCLYVNSGSSALYIGIEALNLPEGSEVITPALTFSTSVGCLVKNNLVPVFVDVDLTTYCIDCEQIEKNINKNTRAILAPNLLGNLCNWPLIRNIADKYNLVVIEDSADTLGAKIDGKSSGFYSDISITSFYGSHIINCAGNGGALAINDENVLSEAKLLRSWGRSSSLFDEKSESINNRFNVSLEGIEYDAKFVFEKVGYNVEGNEVGASFGLAQLKKLNQNIQTRKKNFNRQFDFFENHNQFFMNPLQNENVDTAWLAYPILIKEDAPFTRREFQIYLEERNIQTRVVFTGNILKQPMTKNIEKKISEYGYKNSDLIMKQGVLLPVHHGLTDRMFTRLHKTINEFLSKF
ncbi:NDP-hexose 3,4-dehydratase [Prochlorococcus marinus subsp. pastoris str. CCMP1986]|uniref:NDP-hexose 3,4-dehydratase n=1 Tax=Prochlorococcus marinus subsp. pastoris (strain CCMP1986 / NIES-2087 / MED4) TaxID=59919 RepID=Q7V0Q1_PROMP|nr:DegT/DnrJ/EryC1/StrS family aminotransferase [Prochlorococcus marinus]CAE19664.1 NDP-hexose 3,4-dehydratase [Prochlorococcus marinus subsp. pastoris str. CCMP1986]